MNKKSFPFSAVALVLSGSWFTKDYYLDANLMAEEPLYSFLSGHDEAQSRHEYEETCGHMRGPLFKQLRDFVSGQKEPQPELVSLINAIDPRQPENAATIAAAQKDPAPYTPEELLFIQQSAYRLFGIKYLYEELTACEQYEEDVKGDYFQTIEDITQSTGSAYKYDESFYELVFTPPLSPENQKRWQAAKEAVKNAVTNTDQTSRRALKDFARRLNALGPFSASQISLTTPAVYTDMLYEPLNDPAIYGGAEVPQTPSASFSDSAQEATALREFKGSFYGVSSYQFAKAYLPALIIPERVWQENEHKIIYYFASDKNERKNAERLTAFFRRAINYGASFMEGDNAALSDWAVTKQQGSKWTAVIDTTAFSKQEHAQLERAIRYAGPLLGSANRIGSTLASDELANTPVERLLDKNFKTADGHLVFSPQSHWGKEHKLAILYAVSQQTTRPIYVYEGTLFPGSPVNILLPKISSIELALSESEASMSATEILDQRRQEFIRTIDEAVASKENTVDAAPITDFLASGCTAADAEPKIKELETELRFSPAESQAKRNLAAVKSVLADALKSRRDFVPDYLQRPAPTFTPAAQPLLKACP